jgi:uncharacterized protein with HEPN domain
MSVSEADRAFLWDMLQAARLIQHTLSQISREQFLEDYQPQSIVERQFEILGEAARGVSAATRQQHPEVPWRKIVGLRNIISHQYQRVDYAILWTIGSAEVSSLIAALDPLVPPPPEES